MLDEKTESEHEGMEMKMENYTATMVEPTTAERLLEGAKRVGELAEKESHEAEVNATISQNVIDLIKETEISRILLPKEYGGPQVNLKHFQILLEPSLTIICQPDG